MSTRTQLQDYWNQVNGMIRDRWGAVTDEDLQQVQGNTERLVGMIQQKTGESRRDIEQFINNLMQEAETMIEQATGKTQQYVSRAAEAAREGYEQVEHQLETGYNEARKLVKTYPAESLLVAAGIGAIAGVVLCLTLRPKRS